MLQPWADGKDLLRDVRWSRLSHFETESLLSSQPQLRDLLPQLIGESGYQEARGWPQQLLLVASLGSHLTLQCYDLERKCWTVLARKHSPGWMKFSGATQNTEGKLIFSHVNSDTPWNPFTLSSYDVWEDSWSFPREEQTPVKTTKGCQPQSLVSVKEEIFTVLAEGKVGRAVLYGASRLSSPSPLYITYGPPATLNNNGTPGKYQTGANIQCYSIFYFFNDYCLQVPGWF